MGEGAKHSLCFQRLYKAECVGTGYAKGENWLVGKSLCEVTDPLFQIILNISFETMHMQCITWIYRF